LISQGNLRYTGDIDILVNVPGIVFSEVHPRHITGKIGGKDAPILALEDLIKSK